MPYLNVRLAREESTEVTNQIVSALMKHTAEILGKKPEVTSIAVDYIRPDSWFVGGARLDAQNVTTFYLDIKITEGTNSKSEKAQYVTYFPRILIWTFP